MESFLRSVISAAPNMLATAKLLLDLLSEFSGSLLREHKMVDLAKGVEVLSKLQSRAQVVEEERLLAEVSMMSLEEKEEEEEHGFERSKPLMRYAMAAYGKSLPRLLKLEYRREITDWNESTAIENTVEGADLGHDLLAWEWKGDKLHPGYFVMVDREGGRVIVSIRGTYNFGDVVTDLLCNDVDFVAQVLGEDDGVEEISGKVHEGFMCAAQTLDDRLRNRMVEIMQEHADKRLCIVGHSMGGSIACLLTLLWGDVAELAHAECYAFAPAPTFDIDLATSHVVTSRIHSVIIGKDVVSRAGKAQIHEIRIAMEHLMTRLDDGTDNEHRVYRFHEISKELKDMSPEQAFENYERILQEQDEHDHDVDEENAGVTKLYVGGQLWYVPLHNLQAHEIHEDTPANRIVHSYLEHILIDKDMVSAHTASFRVFGKLSGLHVI